MENIIAASCLIKIRPACSMKMRCPNARVWHTDDYINNRIKVHFFVTSLGDVFLEGLLVAQGVTIQNLIITVTHTFSIHSIVEQKA